MDDWYPTIPSISDKDWASLTEAEQDRYNEAVDAKNEYIAAKINYATSMSLAGPVVFLIVGMICCLLFGALIFGYLLQMILFAIIIISAAVWAIIRVAARSHAYLRYKDAETALKVALADLPKIPEPPAITPGIPTQVESVDEPADERRRTRKAVLRGIVIGVVVVLVIGVVIVWGDQWNTYCSNNYPGTTFNLLAYKCETPAPFAASGDPSTSPNRAAGELSSSTTTCQDYGSVYLDGIITSNLNFDTYFLVSGKYYDENNVMVGSGEDYVLVDADGSSKYHVIITDVGYHTCANGHGDVAITGVKT